MKCLFIVKWKWIVVICVNDVTLIRNTVSFSDRNAFTFTR